jgi:hypothetical protein
MTLENGQNMLVQIATHLDLVFFLPCPFFVFGFAGGFRRAAAATCPGKHRLEAHGKALGQVIQTTVDNSELKWNMISLCCSRVSTLVISRGGLHYAW